MSRRVILIPGFVLALAIFFGVAFGLGWLPRRGTASVPTRPIPTVSRTGVPPEVLARWDALENADRLAEETIWAPELIAQRYENQFIEAWDRLRHGEDFAQVAADVDFTTLELPAFGSAKTRAQGIRHRRSGVGGTRWTARDWRRQLVAWRDEGWRLDGSEWRLPWFSPPSPGRGAAGRFTVEIHAEHPATQRRLIVRGSLEVQWRPPEDDTLPAIDEMRFHEAECLDRTGPPSFSIVARNDISPDPGALTIDPLILQDLDGDGWDDVILAGKNRVFRNRGGGSFSYEVLAPALNTVMIGALVADFDGDGKPDFMGVDGDGLVWVPGDGAGHFPGGPRRQPLPNLSNPFVLAAGDVDGDGDLDLWVGQYKVPYKFGQMPSPYHDANDGFPSYLLLNDGHGHFTDATEAAGLGAKRWRRTYGASFVDLDDDGDLDLVVVSDFAGVDLYLNDGRGHFRDVTVGSLPVPRLFGMAQVVADFNGDGRPDLLAIGMNSPVAQRLVAMHLGPPGFESYQVVRPDFAYGNRTWMNRGGGRFEAAPFADELAATGWSWGAAVADLDNDGREDVYVVNGHKTRDSAREYEPQFWMHDLYAGTRTNLDPALDLHFQAVASRRYGAGESYGGNQRNKLFLAGADGHFTEVAWLLGAALPDDCRNLGVTDLDGDGRLDLVVTTARFGAKPGQELLVLRNGGPVGNWVALRLESGPKGGAWGAARVELQTTSGLRYRWHTVGDSYRLQQSTIVHFGLAPDERPVRFRVRGAGGRKWETEAGEAGRVYP